MIKLSLAISDASSVGDALDYLVEFYSIEERTNVLVAFAKTVVSFPVSMSYALIHQTISDFLDASGFFRNVVFCVTSVEPF
ncbi:hypothetical protein [Sigmofec virus UA08Rod_6396]|uniref:Uncharacterized protein n=1 Tax=Sigmofec virus UA08Rod_6396 TaxID=2929227 RepID=A0A976N1D5_9VIRU|nr:hypothetical protein [Sigmofec virus UA08Rod_6396]